MNPIEALTAQLMPHLMLAPIALPLLTAALMLLLREEQQRLKVSLNLLSTFLGLAIAMLLLAWTDQGVTPATLGVYLPGNWPAPFGIVLALDAYLLTVAEHGMNASTFTARVVASTRSDAVSVVVSALGALKGPLHGGAPGPVLDMLDAIREPARARAWLEAELDSGRRIMGLGHRIYRVRDPRAAILERALDALEAAGIESRYLGLARAVERAAVELLAERRPERRLETNVEFYTAVLLDAIGLDRALFTAAFAVARIAGWLAHADEQIRGGRILRPRQRYVGPLPEGGTTTRLSASG